MNDRPEPPADDSAVVDVAALRRPDPPAEVDIVALKRRGQGLTPEVDAGR
jgi:hypothetical protein